MEIKVLGGSRSIGGNFIKITDGERTLVFDQGIRFDIMNNYYTRNLTPQGVTELRELGILPRAEWYEGANGIYITHLHLDHLGALANIPFETKVYLPNLGIYEDMEARWQISPSWLSLIPRKYYLSLDEIKPLEADENEVVAIPVSHSAYPAYALLYFGESETILYTGDYRTDGFLTKNELWDLNGAPDLFTYLQENKDIKIDTLITEGTNIGSNRAPITPIDALNIIKRSSSTSKILLFTIHSLDLEYAQAIIKLATELGLECFVGDNQIVSLVQNYTKHESNIKTIEGYTDVTSNLEGVSLDEIENRSLVLISYWNIIDFLKELASTQNLSDSTAILSEPEPENEEASEYTTFSNWMSRLGVQHYRLRVSGHYYPYEIRKIKESINPKRIIPIHTENPELTKHLWSKYKL